MMFVLVLCHLVLMCCFIGSEEMVLSSRAASVSFGLALFLNAVLQK